ncbi:MAG: CARDB domain-containing protein [Candidatus Poseidoniales archaeon]
MQQKRGVLLACLFLLPLLIQTTSAESSGNIEASTAQLSMSPNEPVVGGDATFSIILTNVGSVDAFDVKYEFFKGAVGENLFKSNVVDIPQGQSVIVSATWGSVPEGDQRLWFQFKDGNSAATNFYYDFNVLGLPTLRVMDLETTPSEAIRAGDALEISMRVKNTGTVDAPQSTLLLQVPGQTDQYLATPALTAGEETWINVSTTAPQTGSHQITATPDINNDIEEGSETNKAKTLDITVIPHMDLYFKEGIAITSVGDMFEGPWSVSGTLVRSNGDGTTTVSLQLEIPNPAGGVLRTNHFEVTLTGSSLVEQPFTYEFSLDSLPSGQHIVTATINSINDASIVQERIDNDEATTTLNISEVPDVVLDPAIANLTSVDAGGEVSWLVTITNNGDIDVSGVLFYKFDDGAVKSIRIDPFRAQTTEFIVINLSSGLGQHEAIFNASWVSDFGSYDADLSNSVSTGKVNVNSPLKLKWDYASLQVLDADGENATFPLRHEQMYTLSIDLTATSSTGSINMTCDDDQGDTTEKILISIEEERQRINVQCDFMALASISNVKLIPDNSNAIDSLSRSFQTINPNGNLDSSADASRAGTATILGLSALVLVGVLIVAFLLTRDREEDVERDIFDYCPACDGELEGGEDRCPHCSFNLKKARNQFHDCSECGESIPDLLENCAYCGAVQDVSSFFERRQRREPQEKKSFVALPEVEEEDDDEIVTGQEDFDSTIREFGYNEEQLEDEWDANIEAAEAEVEAAYDRRFADEIAEDEMTEEELEAYKSQVTTTIRKASSADHDIDAILKGKKSMKSVKEDDSELSASDAHIREQLFEITGEEGVLPGEKVQVGMQLSDSSLAGNEVQEAAMDFTIEEEDLPTAKQGEEVHDELNPQRSRTSRRRPNQKKTETAECGACGAEIEASANECNVCGAQFE